MKALNDVDVDAVVLATNSGAELIDEAIPVRRDSPHESVALQRQLQTKQTIKKLLVPADPRGELLGAQVGITSVALHVRVLDAPIAQVGEESHRVGILRAKKNPAL